MGLFLLSKDNEKQSLCKKNKIKIETCVFLFRKGLGTACTRFSVAKAVRGEAWRGPARATSPLSVAWTLSESVAARGAGWSTVRDPGAGT